MARGLLRNQVGIKTTAYILIIDYRVNVNINGRMVINNGGVWITKSKKGRAKCTKPTGVYRKGNKRMESKMGGDSLQTQYKSFTKEVLKTTGTMEWASFGRMA